MRPACGKVRLACGACLACRRFHTTIIFGTMVVQATYGITFKTNDEALDLRNLCRNLHRVRLSSADDRWQVACRV
jgi:hypothetical protein